jgi:hypothetical protein
MGSPGPFRSNFSLASAVDLLCFWTMDDCLELLAKIQEQIIECRRTASEARDPPLGQSG